LDEESQRKVQDALDKVMVNRTSIVIAHRLTTVEKCQRIAVIQDGVVIESGSIADLREIKDGAYARLAAGLSQK
jgi:ATP-binding cassette subfamily B (MDR/TAP) protein 1